VKNEERMSFIKRSVVNLDLSVEDLPSWMSGNTKADPAACADSELEDAKESDPKVEDSKQGE
jgi:hypothetical protein